MSGSPNGDGGLVPGQVVAAEGDLELNPGRARRVLRVENTGDRPVQVGSHFHFADVNPALRFDRPTALGYRLDVPAGTGVRFEPGLAREVTLVALAGAAVVPGLQIRTVEAADGAGGLGGQADLGGEA